MTALLWLLPALPLAGGAALAVTGSRGRSAAPALAVAVSAVVVILAVAVTVGRPVVRAPLLDGLAAGLAVDGLSAVLVVTVSTVALAVVGYAAAEMRAEAGAARFFGLLLVFVGAMLVTVTATTLPTLLMAWEVMGATSYGLIAHWWPQPPRVSAANTAFLTTRTADLGLYIAAGAALAGGRGRGGDPLSLAFLAGLPSPWLHVAAAGILVSALGKSAQLPFSFWLSRAMAGPSPVSALLHSATMVAAGAYLLLRMEPLLAQAGWAADAAAWVGALTALLLGAVALGQRDLKQLLAASTCSQVGFMVLAAGAGGVTEGTAQLVAHAAVKSLLFLVAGAWLAALGTKDLAALRGAARRFPAVGVLFAVGSVSLAGLPPLALWLTKDAILGVAGERSVGLYVVALAASAVSAAYAVLALVAVLGRAPADPAPGWDAEQPGSRHVSVLQVVPMVPLAAGAAGLGALLLPAAMPRWVGEGEAVGPSLAALLFSAALAAAVAVVSVLWHRGAGAAPAARVVPLARWLGLERAATVLVVRPTLALARAAAAMDDRGVDGAVRGLVRLTRAAADGAGRRGEGVVDGAVEGVARGARAVGRLARRPQTGQLHQYYAQAFTAFGVLVVVLLLLAR